MDESPYLAAIQKAHDAGDFAGAQKIADFVKASRASAPVSDVGAVMRSQGDKFMTTLRRTDLPDDQRASTESDMATLMKQPEMAGVDVSTLGRQAAPTGQPQQPLPAPSGAPATPTGMGGSQQAPAAAPEGFLAANGSSPWLDRAQYGLANVGIRGYLGAKNTLGYKLDPEEQNVLAQSNADVEHSGFVGKSANLIGNVGAGVAASMLAPAGLLPATVGALGKLGPAAATALKAAVGSGAYEGTFEPAADQDNIALSKTKQALKAAALGAGLTGAAGAITKAGTGLFEATKDARDLFAQGINPTLQQAAESRVGKFIGGLTSGFTDTKNRQEQELLDALTNKISDGKVDMPGSTVNQRVGALTDSIGQELKEVYKGKLFPITTALKDAMQNVVDGVSKNGAFTKEQAQVGNVVDNILPERYTRMGIDTFRDRLINPLDEAINNASNSRVAQALSDVRDVVLNHHNAQMSPEELAALEQIKPRAQDLERLTAATSSGGGEQEGVKVLKLATQFDATPAGKASATNQDIVGPAARVFGQTARQDEARTALVNAGRALAIGGGGVLTGHSVPTATLYGLSLAGQTGRGARVLTGQTAPQIALKDTLESPQTGQSVSDAVSNGIDTSTLTMANLLRSVRDNMSAVGNAFTGPKLPPNAKYEDYIRAYDAAPDKQAKIRLGQEWTAQQTQGN